MQYGKLESHTFTFSNIQSLWGLLSDRVLGLHLSNVQLFPEIPVSEDTDESVSAHTVLYVDNQLLMSYY